MIAKGYVFGIGYALVCLLLSLIIYKLGVPKKFTRKFVHILVGFEWFILYAFFGAGVHFLAVCIFFLVLLTVAHFKKLMPMISSEGENSPGTVYYAIAMTGVAIVGCFVPDVMIPFGIGIMCTSIGDGMAGVVGQAITFKNIKIYHNKSLYGSLANFVFSFLSALVLSSLFSVEIYIWQCAIIALFAVELELFTGFGFDNISITWGITALAYCFVNYPSVNNYLLPILLSPIIIAFACSKKALTKGGVCLAIIMDVFISLTLGNVGFLILILFFVGSIGVDKVKKRVKNHSDEALKGDCRDIMQVTANGAVGCVLAIFYFFTQNYIFLIAYVASFAEAFSDTVASGIGIFSKKTFDPFRFKSCDKGVSGGMSLLGTVSSLIASFALSAVGLLFVDFSVKHWIIASLCAFFGCIFDSLLGSLLQAKYRCIVCGKVTEKNVHCGKNTELNSGLSIVDNDIVNLSSGVFASLVCLLVANFL